MAQETRSIEDRLTRLEVLLETVVARLDRLEARHDMYFRWTMGVMLTMWVTVIAVVLGALLIR